MQVHRVITVMNKKILEMSVKPLDKLAEMCYTMFSGNEIHKIKTHNHRR